VVATLLPPACLLIKKTNKQKATTKTMLTPPGEVGKKPFIWLTVLRAVEESSTDNYHTGSWHASRNVKR